MIKRLFILLGIFALGGCATSTAVGNDAYAMVAAGENSQPAAQAWCETYAKVPQLRNQDKEHGTDTYDCVIPARASVSAR
jgi:hypothetical protein